MAFDQQAFEEGYSPCARGSKFCELELVRPGKVQCPCDNPESLAAELREIAEESQEQAQALFDLSWE